MSLAAFFREMGIDPTDLFDAKIEELVARHDTYQQRVREWVKTPAFLSVYHDLHPGPILKFIADLLGSGKTMIKRNPQLQAEYMRLEKEGELRFAAPVIANAQMEKLRSIRYPAGVVASDSQDASSLKAMIKLAHRLMDAYSGQAPDMPGCTRIISDDTFRAMRRDPLPVEETGGISASLYCIRASAFQISLNDGGYPFLPLLVMPGGGPFVYVPWPILEGKPMPVYTPKPRPEPPSVPPAGPPPIPR